MLNIVLNNFKENIRFINILIFQYLIGPCVGILHPTFYKSEKKKFNMIVILI